MKTGQTSSPAHHPPDLSSLCLVITEHAPLPMATVEQASHIVRYVNPAFCRMIDKPMEQLVGKPFYDLLPEKDECVTLLDRVFRTGQPESHTEQQHSKPHQVFWSYTMWPVITDERPVGVMIQVTETAQFYEKTLAMNEALILGSVHQHELTEASDVLNAQLRTEITERKRAEEQMHDIQSQLEQTNLDLMKRNEEIQYFYHTLSHELKTPLTAAREFVSIVIDGLAGELNSTQLNYLRIAKQSCTELAVYINDLLDATRLDTGKLHIELKAVSLAAIIHRAIAIMEPVAAGKKIRLREELDTDLTNVMVDESRIMQILTNLLNNALKFTFEGGKIIVKLGEDPKNSEYVQISVTDTGCGIPKDQIDNLFHRFYQIKKGDATPEKGVGLGLYLCREMVLLHGGNIWVESALGRGSTFSFTIPKHSDQTTTSRNQMTKKLPQESKQPTAQSMPLQSAPLNEGTNK
jgi:signal transduction histidine kinase